MTEVLKEYKRTVTYKTKDGSIHIYNVADIKKVKLKVTRSELMALIDQIEDYEERVKLRDHIQSIIDNKKT